MSDTPPADWYPDPADDTRLRYWDGTSWTDHTAPRPPATPPSATPSWPTGGPGPAATGDAPAPWLWQSIVATLFCCLPLGVVGIVFATQSMSAAGAGDMVTAARKADSARGWTIASAVVSLVGLAVFATLVAFGGISEVTSGL